ncbi:MAG: urease accessory protein [Bacteroidota bacterium]
MGIFVAVLLGFTHAFEADHIAAVSTMVTKRKRLLLAMKDGMYWGLGHSSTILMIGVLILVAKQNISNETFAYLEALVGLMLILLGGWRLWQLNTERQQLRFNDSGHHLAAYGIGMVHGLAGSGTLLAVVISQLDSISGSLLYLLLFGIGSVIGMLLAAGVFSLPFSRKGLALPKVQTGLVLLSALICIFIGGRLFLENLIG